MPKKTMPFPIEVEGSNRALSNAARFQDKAIPYLLRSTAELA